MWLQGKYPTALKSVCSPWTLVTFIAFFRQIAVNEIAAFWLDTDRKKIMLKKIIAPIHHLFVISRLVCCNSSPWGRHGKYYLHLPGPDSRKKCHDTTYCWTPTLLAKGSTWVSGQQKEGLFFFFATCISLSPLIKPQLLRHSHPTLCLGALPEELREFPSLSLSLTPNKPPRTYRPLRL